MKRTTLLMTISVVLHLVVIDLTFYLVSTNALISGSIIPLGGYNLLWLFIAGTLGIHSYNESREN